MTPKFPPNCGRFCFRMRSQKKKRSRMVPGGGPAAAPGEGGHTGLGREEERGGGGGGMVPRCRKKTPRFFLLGSSLSSPPVPSHSCNTRTPVNTHSKPSSETDGPRHNSPFPGPGAENGQSIACCLLPVCCLLSLARLAYKLSHTYTHGCEGVRGAKKDPAPLS